jgi:hypothetical protein
VTATLTEWGEGRHSLMFLFVSTMDNAAARGGQEVSETNQRNCPRRFQRSRLDDRASFNNNYTD